MSMEIKPMNLTKQVYDPMRGQAREESLSDKMRKTAERRFMRQMREYQIKKQDRDERDYILKQRAENFIFSNYPSDKAFGDFMTAGDERKFAEGSEDKYLQKWKQQVGGNFGAFQQWYQMSKAKEDAAYWKSFQRNPGKYKTEKEYKRALSGFMNEMSEDEQQRFLTTAPPEVLNLIQNNWDAYDSRIFGVKTKDVTKGALGTAAGALTLYGASRLPFLRGRANKLSSLAKENVDKITKGLPKSGMQELADDFIGPGLPTNKISQVENSLKRMVRRNQISVSDSQKLSKVLKELAQEGKTITGKSIGEKLMASPTQYDSLIQGLKNSRIGSVGPLNVFGLKKYLLTTAGVALGADMLGSDSAIDTGFGVASGAQVSTNIYNTISQINQIRNQMGTEKFMSLLKRKMGKRMLTSMALKTIIGGGTGVLGMAVGGASLLFDLQQILNVVKDYNEE